jgi:prepilin-type N-terminal cleavage/methylation domain-containing protein
MMTSAVRNNCRPGWSLLELIAVMAILGVLMAMTFATLAGTVRTEQASVASFHKLAVQSALADLFRADVAQAKAAPDKLDALAKGPACLILELPDRSHIVYRWDKGRLTRSTFSGKKTAEQPVPLGEKRATVEFLWSGEAAHVLLTLRVKGPAAAPLEITAALGGDNR